MNNPSNQPKRQMLDEDLVQPQQKKVEAPVLAEHTVKEGETLSALALKYYGSADREKWMQIYDANKAVIGENPGMLKVGTVLKIPKLAA